MMSLLKELFLNNPDIYVGRYVKCRIGFSHESYCYLKDCSWLKPDLYSLSNPHHEWWGYSKKDMGNRETLMSGLIKKGNFSALAMTKQNSLMKFKHALK
jgi:hypothetical protein